MISGKFNAVTDGQWGSTGKGLFTSYLAWRHRPAFISTTNMANAGHCAVNTDGEVYVAKALPSAAVLNRWVDNYNPMVVVGPSAAFNLQQLLKEAEHCDLTNSQLWVHPRAGVITQEHAEREAGIGDGSTKHIGSTMQGCGTFLADKVLRKRDLKLARDYSELYNFLHLQTGQEGKNYDPDYDPMPLKLLSHMDMGRTILHEGSQGFSLDIQHGSHYPECTSRSTTATQNLTDMGLPFTHMGDVYLVIRPYPIRVGNVIEDGKMVGYSGDAYNGQSELTWEQVADMGGLPEEEKRALLNKELTTVTKRLRRVFTFSSRQVREAAKVNGATKIALNFANYIDWNCHHTNDRTKLTAKVKDFIRTVEDATQTPVTLVGTGPQLDHVIDLETR